MGRKRDLIVPIRDRRQRKRYLTLKNFRNVVIAVVVIFIGISIQSEMRGTKGDYGRLMRRELPERPQPVKKPLEVVTEAKVAPVPDQTHVDPFLVEPLEREQWLHGDPGVPITTATALATPPARAEAAVASGETRVAIVGGIEGVTVVKRERQKPVLSGGFGRQ
ncbi:MAG TPA: hypothetical protein VF846_08175 [Thermoanaerobaculia bacterium]|jgi:hypothetical protein